MGGCFFPKDALEEYCEKPMHMELWWVVVQIKVKKGPAQKR